MKKFVRDAHTKAEWVAGLDIMKKYKGTIGTSLVEEKLEK